MEEHSNYIRQCLDLAYQARGSTSPNPMVGAIIVKDQQVISTGYHKHCGKPHAEVDAINTLKPDTLRDSTLYVNLEPCSHQGKTPPCTDLIISSEISKVVYALSDPNPLVNGEKILNNHQISTVSEILREEATFLNRRFLTFQNKKRPYVILKWAETSDRFIAKSDGSSKWISSEDSRALVHTWRACEDAILVGKNTVLLDNPQLTARNLTKEHANRKQPLRIFLDRNLEISKSFNLLDASTKTLCITEKEKISKNNLEYYQTHFTDKLWQNIFNHLYLSSISSIIIEGGAKTLQSLIDRNLWDEARVFQSSTTFTNGIHSPQLNNTMNAQISKKDLQGDRLTYFFNFPIKTLSIDVERYI